MPLSSSITWKEVIVVVLSATLAVQQKEFVHKSFGRLKKEKKEDKQNIGKAFLVQLDTGCTGPLIAKDWILTAAHCVYDSRKIYVQMGHSDLDSEEIVLTSVESVLVHPEYDTVSKNYYKINDIALLRLEDDLIFDKSVQPIELSTEEVQDSFGPILIFPEGYVTFGVGFSPHTACNQKVIQH